MTAEIAVEALRLGNVVVWAEIGRARMPLYKLLAFGPGGVVELDRLPEDPVDLYVNGRRFATGRLEISRGEWAVRLTEIFTLEQPDDAEE